MAWVIIALAIEGIVGSLSSFAQAALASVIDTPVPISIAAAIGALFQAAIIMFAAFMLRGSSWARTAYVVIAVFIVLAMLPQVLRHTALVPTFVLVTAKTCVFFFFLFRAEANAYFNSGWAPTVEEAGTGQPN
ncbi:MAG: hypothetical protein ACRD3Q_05745 [Terriglobales bacterium]